MPSARSLPARILSLSAGLVLLLAGAGIGAGAFATSMPGSSHHGPLPPRTAREEQSMIRLQGDVRELAGDIGERHLARPGTMQKAAAFVTSSLTSAGYEPTRLPYGSNGIDVANIEVVLKGSALPDEIVVVGAHYDSADEAPGADDNGSGVALLLELARSFKGRPAPRRTLRFVAFANEEPPHFRRDTMGSLVYARGCKERGDRIVAMLSLESLGYFKNDEGSQKYPPVVSLAYPSRGNFVGFVGDTPSRGLVRASVRAFREAATFPSEGASLPGKITGVGWSDQWSFWKMGYPGVMVTDTAIFRNPHYHTPNDRPETLDYDAMARIETGLEAVVAKLVDGDTSW